MMTFPEIFLRALKQAIDLEGLLSNDKHDPGGQTFCGISRVYSPHWPGWPAVYAWIDEGADKDNVPGPVDATRMLQTAINMQNKNEYFFKDLKPMEGSD